MRLKLQPTQQYLGQRLVLDLPDKGSAQKYRASYSSYMFRAYVEFRKLVLFQQENNFGFGLFETLTYRDEFLPHFHGLPCFSSRDITLFFKRLRRNLETLLGHRPNMSYILVCEYGDEKVRPHYHPIFFVFENISRYEFARQVYRAWHCGKTDGYDVYGHPDTVATDKHTLNSFAACRYILKYILKYLNFDEKFKDIVEKLRLLYSNGSDDSELETYRRDCRPFVRCSVGFGFTQDFDNTEDLTIQVPYNDLGEYTDFRAPSYVCRKLFYDKIVDYYREDGKPIYKRTDKGSYLYELNDTGKEYKAKHLETVLDRCFDLYKNIYDNVPQDIRDVIDWFLDGRSLRQLAIYHVVYKDRIWLSTNDALADSVFEQVSYTKFFLDTLEARPIDPDSSFFTFLIQDNSCYFFRSFDYILQFFDCLVSQDFKAQEVHSDLTTFINLNYLYAL